jgi:acylphosphatase
MPSTRIEVYGHVQGVGFRAFVKEQAQSLGLAGYVKNRDDGAVEVLAAGSAAAVEKLTDACRQGPDGAEVRNVKTSEAGSDHFTDFTIRH